MQSDDLHDEVVSIGFPFTFYGNVYNQLVISGNGYVKNTLVCKADFTLILPEIIESYKK